MATKKPLVLGAGGIEVLQTGDTIEFQSGVGASNLIINGDMLVWQRGTTFTSMASGTYMADRFVYFKSGDMVHNAARSTDVPTVAQAGRKYLYSLLVGVATADTLVSGTEFAEIQYRVEGSDFLPYAEKEFTIKFWVKATKTGTYTLGLQSSDHFASCALTYEVNATNTWEEKTINVPASPSSGTWNFSNGSGLILRFVLASGLSLVAGVDNVWQGTNNFVSDDQVNSCDAINSFRITGVRAFPKTQTDVQSRPYAQELSLCFRYTNVYSPAANVPFAVGLWSSAGHAQVAYRFPVRMRAAPTFSFSAASDFILINNNGSATTVNGMTCTLLDVETALIQCTSSSGGVAGDSTMLRSSTSSTSAVIMWEAELV